MNDFISIRVFNSMVMNVKIIAAIFVSICLRRTLCELRDFTVCHHDLKFEPKDGVVPYFTFPWLGFLQYVHETSGRPHVGFAPRVVLIHRQAILTSARTLAELPQNYLLGNVIFPEYLREEHECGLSKEDIARNKRCLRAYIEVPIHKIDIHPEYSRFGIQNSVAVARLITPLKSMYMVPVCLPTLSNRMELKKSMQVVLADYTVVIPRNLQTIQTAIRSVKLFTHRTCGRQRQMSRLEPEGITHMLCTSGCGVRTNSPIISNTEAGRFEIVGIAAGGGPCGNFTSRSMFNDNPPYYIDIYPYYNWITSVISAYVIPNVFAQHRRRNDGLEERSKDVRKRPPEKVGWSGMIYMVGNVCFWEAKSGQHAGSFIYSERFSLTLTNSTKEFIGMALRIKVDCGQECLIVCVRVTLPNKKAVPKVTGIGTSGISMTIENLVVYSDFEMSMKLTGINSTRLLGGY